MEDRVNNTSLMVIPALKTLPEITIDMGIIRNSESRIIEAKTVNPVTYSELEYTFGEGWRDAKQHHATIAYQITKASTLLDQVKSELLIDKYPEFKEAKKIAKTQDNVDMRNAFLVMDQGYLDALDRVNQLKALEAFLDNKIKMFERVSSYMKKEIDILIRGGMADKNLYITSGKK